MRSLSSDDIHYSPKGLFGQSKNLYRYQKWGLGRSPKRGEGGSPTFSPFPGERGLGIGIENKHFFEKTDFFYKLTARKGCFVLPPQSDLHLSTSDGTNRKNVTASCTEYLFYINYKAL